MVCRFTLVEDPVQAATEKKNKQATCSGEFSMAQSLAMPLFLLLILLCPTSAYFAAPEKLFFFFLLIVAD